MMMMMMHGSLPDDLFSRRFRNEAFAGARHTLGYPYSTHTMVTMVIMVIKVVTMVTMVIMVIKVIMVIIITLHHHRQRTLTKWSPLTYIVSRPIDDLCHWYLGKTWYSNVLSLTMVTIVVMQIIMIFKAPH